VRIGFFHMDFDAAGGGEYDTLYLTGALREAGHEPVVITAGGRLCREFAKVDVPVIITHLIKPVSERSLFDLWRNRKGLADIVEQQGLDVLNPQGAYMAWAAGCAARQMRKRGRVIPNIVTIPMLSSMSRIWYRLGSWIINRSADHVIVENTDELRRLRRGKMKRPASLVYTCPPPWRYEAVTQTRQDIRAEMGWADDTLVFLMPARMTAQKNHELLFQVLTRPELENLPALFYLPGDGVLLEKHRQTVKRLALADRVILPGYTSDMMRLYKGADVFLLSTHFESLPVAIREAMMAGLPVIATGVNGIPEAVRDGQTGLLVRKNSADDLAEAIIKMTEDAELRRRFGRAGREFLTERFNYDHWAENTLQVYREVLQRMGVENDCL